MYRAEKKSLQILLSSTQAGPGKKVKQKQEEISRNHVPILFLGSVQRRAGRRIGGGARLNVDRLEERANTKQPQRRQSPSL